MFHVLHKLKSKQKAILRVMFHCHRGMEVHFNITAEISSVIAYGNAVYFVLDNQVIIYKTVIEYA